jgi:hypothetical protein
MIAVFVLLFQADADKYELKLKQVWCGYDAFKFSASNFYVIPNMNMASGTSRRV